MSRLRLYAEQRWLPPGVDHTVMLYPFWGNPMVPARDPVCGDFARYIEQGPSYFALTSLDECDVAVLPFAWEATEQNPPARDAGLQFAEHVAARGKPLAAFYFSDSDEAVPLAATVLRTSFTQRARRPGEFALPAWNEDLVERYCDARLPVRARPAHPVVGFCGRVPRWSRVREALALARGYGPDGGDGLRISALAGLSQSTAVTAAIVRRQDFFGTAALATDPRSRAHAGRMRREYVDNLLGSDYALCIRGAGNYSFRLYEALCCGRIPVVVDSDGVLPYDWEIDWHSVGIWLRPDELDQLGDRVAVFNAALSDRTFVELQHECRRLWEARLSPEGFFRHFHRHFDATP